MCCGVVCLVWSRRVIREDRRTPMQARKVPLIMVQRQLERLLTVFKDDAEVSLHRKCIQGVQEHWGYCATLSRVICGRLKCFIWRLALS
jgi:hypothetical protein